MPVVCAAGTYLSGTGFGCRGVDGACLWSLSWSELPLSYLGLPDTEWGLGREEGVSNTLLALALKPGGVPSRAAVEVVLLVVFLASAPSTVFFQGRVLPILAWSFRGENQKHKRNSDNVSGRGLGRLIRSVSRCL